MSWTCIPWYSMCHIGTITMRRSVKNKKVKNDRMDAFNIATNLMHSSYKGVYIPTEHDNEIYISLREDIIQSRKRIKQQISALVLRRGLRYTGKSLFKKIKQYTNADIKLFNPYWKTLSIIKWNYFSLILFHIIYKWTTGTVFILASNRIKEFQEIREKKEYV